MDRFITFNDSELFSSIYSIYLQVCESAADAALMYVSTKAVNNPNHFDGLLKECNEAVINLMRIFPDHDERRKVFRLLDKEILIKSAEDFFAEDFY